jgi:hypothetical protein
MVFREEVDMRDVEILFDRFIEFLKNNVSISTRVNLTCKFLVLSGFIYLFIYFYN